MVSGFDLSLDMGDINRQIETETLMPAKLVGSEFKDITFTDREGNPGVRKAWQLSWDRLDMDLTGVSGEKFLFRSSHNLPDPNDDRPVRNRRRMTYVQQVDCFGRLGLTGRKPEDFLGVTHWIRETVEGSGQFAKTWYRSEAIYKEGQSFEEAVAAQKSSTATTQINPPEPPPAEEPQEVPLDDNSPYGVLVELMDGKNHREILNAVRSSSELAGHEEIQQGIMSGTLFDDLESQGIIKEGEDGKYHKAIASS